MSQLAKTLAVKAQALEHKAQALEQEMSQLTAQLKKLNEESVALWVAAGRASLTDTPEPPKVLLLHEGSTAEYLYRALAAGVPLTRKELARQVIKLRPRQTGDRSFERVHEKVRLELLGRSDLFETSSQKKSQLFWTLRKDLPPLHVLPRLGFVVYLELKQHAPLRTNELADRLFEEHGPIRKMLPPQFLASVGYTLKQASNIFTRDNNAYWWIRQDLKLSESKVREHFVKRRLYDKVSG